jgi:hypothetical protein
VEVVLSGEQAEALAEQGIELAPKEIDGQTAAELSTQQAAEGYVVYRTYREPGGIKDEIEQATADNSAITKLVTIGQSVQGKDILALKVTNKAKSTKDDRRFGAARLRHRATCHTAEQADFVGRIMTYLLG